MKKFFSEFKKFINRGNGVDLSVGVMIGSAFTAIVNGLGNFILKPLVNYFIASILGGDSISSMHTYLTTVYAEDGTIDLSQSIYIDWSSFISVVLNFVIIAFVLFTIVKIINKFFGESITVSGLMTGRDLADQLQGCELGDGLLLPATTLRADGDLFLCGMTPEELSKKLGGVEIGFVRNDGAELLSAILGQEIC